MLDIFSNFGAERYTSFIEIVSSNPELKYAYFISAQTFSALLCTNQQEALRYGENLMEQFPVASNHIISSIAWYSDKLNLSPAIYVFGAKVCVPGKGLHIIKEYSGIVAPT